MAKNSRKKKIQNTIIFVFFVLIVIIAYYIHQQHSIELPVKPVQIYNEEKVHDLRSQKFKLKLHNDNIENILDTNCKNHKAHQITAKHYKDNYPNNKIGMVLAGNSGVPGGYIGKFYKLQKDTNDDKNEKLFWDSLTKPTDTQEENVLQDWIRASTRLGRKETDTLDLIINEWGFEDPSQKDTEEPDFSTKQLKKRNFPTNYYHAKKDDSEIFTNYQEVPDCS